MKNYSARRLLTMAMAGQHMPYCQNTKFPVVNCLCLQHEVKVYQDRLAAKAKLRVRKPRAKKPTRVHFDFVGYGITKKMGCKNKQNMSSDVTQVTCQHCLKATKKLKVSLSAPSYVTTGVNHASLLPSNP